MLDTYFLHLEKEEKVTASVTFTVTDNDGNTASETGKVLIKYNHPPIIEAQNLSFYTHEIMQFPDRVKKEILEMRLHRISKTKKGIGSRISNYPVQPLSIFQTCKSRRLFYYLSCKRFHEKRNRKNGPYLCRR